MEDPEVRVDVKDTSEPVLCKNEKRWLIIGIIVHTILAPVLRKKVATHLDDLWLTLKQECHIDRQSHPDQLKSYMMTDLNYEAINNNKHGRRQQDRYDYTVKDSVDLSKLFLRTNMTHYIAFDETCDLASLLEILICTFPPQVRDLAAKIRSQVRNQWAHCNVKEWDETKYEQCKSLLDQFIRNLGLSKEDENKVVVQLKEIYRNGKMFIEGNAHIENIDMLLKKADIGTTVDTSEQVLWDENVNRWTIIGIILNMILAPVLRKNVATHLASLWITLKQECHIDRQSHPDQLKSYMMTDLNYEAINNNKQHGQKLQHRYDYTVKDSVDLSKLFLRTHMTHYIAFDETCHLASLLEILIRTFPPQVRDLAAKIRSEVRNLWVRCNFKEWDETKYEECKSLLDQFIRNLGLSKEDENKVVVQLIKLYRKDVLVSYGTYQSYDNTVHLTGACNVGKSTLASVFIGNEVPLKWNSTDGLVIYFGQNGINLKTKEMEPLHEDFNLFAKVLRGEPEVSDIKDVNPVSFQRKFKKCRSNENTYPLTERAYVEELLNDSITPSSQHISSDEESYYESSVFPSEENPVTMEDDVQIHLPEATNAQQECYRLREEFLEGVRNGTYRVKIAPSDVVDFGGQRSFDMTHQLFVRQKGTFVVMFDGYYGLYDNLPNYRIPTTNKEIIIHWVNSILTYCVDDGIMPMILFAATHKDHFNNDDELIRTKKVEFKRSLEQIFDKNEMKNHIDLNEVFFMDTRDPKDTDIDLLKQRLVDIAMRQPSWGERRPVRWVPLEIQIAQMKKNQFIITKNELMMANGMNGDLALLENGVNEFLEFQHSVGKLMYFNRPWLDGFIILHPPSLVNILKSFITDEMFWEQYGDQIRTILQCVHTTGEITNTQLETLWQQEQLQITSPEMRIFIRNLLVYLDILIIPRQYRPSDSTSHWNSEYYMVPCVIRERLPMSFLDEISFQYNTIALQISFRISSIPTALSFKLIGAIASIWPIKKISNKFQLFLSAAVLSIDEENDLRVMIENDRVIAYLTNTKCRYRISPDLAACIRECIVNALNYAMNFYNTSLGSVTKNFNPTECYEILIGEVCCKQPCVITAAEAREKSEWICAQGHCHKTDLASKWLFDKNLKTCPQGCGGLNKDLLEQRVEDLHIIRLSEQLGREAFRNLILNLGITCNELENLEHEHRDSMVVMVLGFKKWIDKSARPEFVPSLEKIQNALFSIGIKEHYLCKVFRTASNLQDIASIELQQRVEDQILSKLAKHMGYCTVPLGIELGLSIPTIENVIYSNPKNIFDQTYEILRTWKQSCTVVEPTIFRLMQAVEKVQKGGLQFLLDMYTNIV